MKKQGPEIESVIDEYMERLLKGKMMSLGWESEVGVRKKGSGGEGSGEANN